jgi:hypothetical protein
MPGRPARYKGVPALFEDVVQPVEYDLVLEAALFTPQLLLTAFTVKTPLSTVNEQGSFGLGVTLRNVCADLFLRRFDRGRSNLIGVDRLGTFTFLVVIADVTGMGLFAFLA